MAYVPVRPPFEAKLRAMPRKELDQYFRWFLDVIPERVAELTHAVRVAAGYEEWRPDQTPESLNVLGQWFAGRVETRVRTSAEQREIGSQIGIPTQISAKDLTDLTYSLAMDVGMHFGQVMLANHPSLRWAQMVDDKRFIDFGHAVIIGITNAPLNPLRIMVVFARSIANNTKTAERLRELYEVWSAFIEKSDGMNQAPPVSESG